MLHGWLNEADKLSLMHLPDTTAAIDEDPLISFRQGERICEHITTALHTIDEATLICVSIASQATENTAAAEKCEAAEAAVYFCEKRLTNHDNAWFDGPCEQAVKAALQQALDHAKTQLNGAARAVRRSELLADRMRHAMSALVKLHKDIAAQKQVVSKRIDSMRQAVVSLRSAMAGISKPFDIQKGSSGGKT